METKRLIITISDCDTGEIIGSNKKERYLPLDYVPQHCQTWFESFMRGLKQYPDKELSLCITVRSYKSPQQKLLDLF